MKIPFAERLFDKKIYAYNYKTIEKRLDMRVLLSTLNSKYIHTALSLRYLKSFAEKEIDSSIEIREYTINQNINHIIGEIYRYKPDILAFSVYIWNANEILNISKAIKMVLPDLKIVLGGPEVSFDLEDIMDKHRSVDVIVYGEGEIAFTEVLKRLEGGDTLESTKGIAYRGENCVCINPPQSLVDLCNIPSVYGENLDEYENKIIYYESSRGCPFNCKFCLSSTIKGVRFFNIESVKADLKKFVDGKVKQVKFIDRTFNAKREHAMEILKFISENDNGYTNFHFEITAHLLDEEMLEFLSKIKPGLIQFEIGVQSTNEDTIKSINRTTNFEKLSYVVNRLRENNNIHLHLDLIAGLPYEDYGSFEKSFNDVYGLKPEKLQLGFLKLLKGSKLREEGDIHGYKFLDRAPYEVMENKYISYEDMLKIKDIEELVEVYGNEKNFEKSVSYLIENKYHSPFEYYEDFASYWRNCGYYESPHSKVAQYEILYEFFKGKYPLELEVFKELLRFDFIRNTKSPNVPIFMGGKELEVSKDDKQLFFKDENIRAKYFGDVTYREYNKLHKTLHLEEFKYDILNKKSGTAIYMFDYRLSSREIQKSRVKNIKEDIEGVIK